MLSRHLTDKEIQQYLLEELPMNEDVTGHIHACEACSAKLAAYHLLFTGLKKVEKPAFAFNLSELITAQLPGQQVTAKKDRLIIFLVAAIVVLVGIAGYLFRQYLSFLFEGLASLAVYLTATSVAVILFFVCLDMYKNFQKKMQVLDMV